MNTAELLRHTRLFRQAPEDALLVLSRAAVLHRFEYGQRLWQASDRADALAVIARGLLKVIRPLPNGKESIVGVFGPHESVGDMAVISGGTFPAAAQVCTPYAVVLRVPRAAVLEQMAHSSELATSVAQAVS